MILSIRDHPTLYSKARTFQALGTLSMMSPKSGLMLRVEFQNIQILFHFKTSSDSFRSMIASSWKDSDIPGMKRPSAPPMLFFFSQSTCRGLGMKSCNSCLIMHMLWSQENVSPTCIAAVHLQLTHVVSSGSMTT